MKDRNDTGEMLREALEAQQQALSKLTDLTETHAQVIAGLVVSFRALMDLLLDDQQRAALETHLSMMTSGDMPKPGRSIVDALLD
jgi:hypothetical protein